MGSDYEKKTEIAEFFGVKVVDPMTNADTRDLFDALVDFAGAKGIDIFPIRTAASRLRSATRASRMMQEVGL